MSTANVPALFYNLPNWTVWACKTGQASVTSNHLFQQVDGDFNRNYLALFDVAVNELTKLRALAAALLSQEVSSRQVSVAVVLSAEERQVKQKHHTLGTSMQHIIVNATHKIISF